MPIQSSSADFLDSLKAGKFPSELATIVDDNSIDQYAPHKIYTMALNDLAQEKGLDSATLVGWRIFHHEDTDAVIEVYRDENDDTYEFGGVIRGPFVQGTRDANAQASSLSEAQEDDFEPVVLDVPGLSVMAFWLKNTDLTKDILIPMEPTHSSLEANRPYSGSEFTSQLSQAAKTRIAFDDIPEG